FVTLALTPPADKRMHTHEQTIAESLTVLAAAEGITLNVLELTEEQIAAKLLAGEGDIDLFVMKDSALALEKPYWNPLDGFQALEEVKTKLTDGAIRCSSYRGNWFGIPIFGGIGRAAWTVSEALAAEIGLTEEETVSLGMTDGTWTLRDYYALALRAKEKGIFVSRWFPLGREEYAARFFALSDTGETAGKLTDDGTYLREMLSLSKTMADEGLYDEFYTGDRVLMELGARDGILVFSPTFDGERHYPVSMRYFMMNSASERQEDAAKVLAMIADPENRFWPEVISGFRLYRDGAEEDPVFRAAEPYFTILPGLSREWMNFAGEEGWKYMNSEQDLDYTVRRILDRAKMVMEG
ncbi:MAG: extracellular solute-binding protein, partial [Clostridia bacterium]|nr:extracellular solute-binding protein [Clostridia bacterium]